LSFEFIAPGKQRNQTDGARQESGLLDRLRARIPILKTGLDLAAELARMLRKQMSQPLADWLAKAEASGIAEVVNFAVGLRQDEAAVAAALSEPWNNGQAEGR
jgi:transposase